LYLDRLYLEQRFLNIAQAVESYHRRRSDKKDLSEEDHEKRLEKILAGTPQEYKKWLSDKLKYSNELSLRQRLKDLLGDANRSQVALSLIGSKKVFIDKVVREAKK
jgi:ApeA N-terminal domain 1